MTTLLEASRLALEALEKLSDAADGFSVSGVYFNEEHWAKECLNKSYDAITALRQAIEQAQKQEPVAWRNAALRVGEDLCSVGPFGYYDMTVEQWLEWALSVVTVHAPPPQRQPLTWERVLEIGLECANDRSRLPYEVKVARAIEAAHGIKGEA